MKQFSLFIISLFLFQAAFAQDVPVQEPEKEDFPIVEVQPEFPGGEDAMMRYIQSRITYPDTAQNLGIQGIVYVQFVVDTVGDVSNVAVIRGVHWSIDEEAIRVIQRMPRWTPGRSAGKAVRVKFTLPITFRLH